MREALASPAGALSLKMSDLLLGIFLTVGSPFLRLWLDPAELPPALIGSRPPALTCPGPRPGA